MHLHEDAGKIGIEILRHRNDRRPGAEARHQTLHRLHFVSALGVDVDHDD